MPRDVGGTVSGLWLSNHLVLQEAASGQEVTVAADGSFAFAAGLAEGSNYAVSVKTLPEGQACAVANGTGTVAAADVSSVTVTCTTHAAYRDHSGTEFVLGVAPNIGGTYSLAFSGDKATSGTVQIPALSYNQAFTVTPGSVTRVVLPAGAETAGDNRGVLVTADDPIVAVGAAAGAMVTSSGSYLALPSDLLATEYLVPSYTGLVGVPAWASQALIVATDDSTSVTITAPVASTAGAAGTPVTITLDRLDTYLLQADAGGDLSGTALVADHPVAVFSGNVATTVPTGTGYSDHLVEQVLPRAAAGSTHHVVPFATRTAGDIIRIVGTADGTGLVYTPAVAGAPASVNEGGVVEFSLPSSTYLTIAASAPVLVTQYAKGSVADGVNDSDPFMVTVQAEDHFLTRYTFVTGDTEEVSFSSHLNLVMDPGEAADCLYDGAPLPSLTFTALGAGGYSGARMPVTAGAHTIMCPSPFGATVYGFASQTAYGHPAGIYLP